MAKMTPTSTTIIHRVLARLGRCGETAFRSFQSRKRLTETSPRYTVTPRSLSSMKERKRSTSGYG